MTKALARAADSLGNSVALRENWTPPWEAIASLRVKLDAGGITIRGDVYLELEDAKAMRNALTKLIRKRRADDKT